MPRFEGGGKCLMAGSFSVGGKDVCGMNTPVSPASFLLQPASPAVRQTERRSNRGAFALIPIGDCSTRRGQGEDRGAQGQREVLHRVNDELLNDFKASGIALDYMQGLSIIPSQENYTKTLLQLSSVMKMDPPGLRFLSCDTASLTFRFTKRKRVLSSHFLSPRNKAMSQCLEIQPWL